MHILSGLYFGCSWSAAFLQLSGYRWTRLGRERWHSGTSLALDSRLWTAMLRSTCVSSSQCSACETSQELSRFHRGCRKEQVDIWEAQVSDSVLIETFSHHLARTNFPFQLLQRKPWARGLRWRRLVRGQEFSWDVRRCSAEEHQRFLQSSCWPLSQSSWCLCSAPSPAWWSFPLTSTCLPWLCLVFAQAPHTYLGSSSPTPQLSGQTFSSVHLCEPPFDQCPPWAWGAPSP